MTSLVGVRFRPSGKIRYFEHGGYDLKVGDKVLVETDDGEREGRVVVAPSQIIFSDLRGPLNSVLCLISKQ